MKRTFLSLYLVIVVSFLAFSWATERVWQSQFSGEEAAVSKADERFVNLIANIAQEESNALAVEKLKTLIGDDDIHLEVLRLDELANSEMKQYIFEGGIVPVSTDANTIYFYKRIPDTHFAIKYRKSHSPNQTGTLYILFGIAFYFLIAIAVYVWVFPLSRDLKLLRNSTRTLMNSEDDRDITLNQRSAVYELAQAFNTMRRRIQSLVASQKEMTHAMSHELRTPLARMKFNLASLESRLGNQDDALLQIRQDISEMDTLISDFLNYASFEERQKNLRFERGSLAPMIRNIVDNLDLTEQVEIVDSLKSRHVFCEWFLIEHCVRILLENAGRHMQEVIRVELLYLDNTYLIRVEDDGAGVAEEEREAIFKAFYKSSLSSNKKSYKTSHSELHKRQGFGLGLALVHRMMRWHNGAVSCRGSMLGGALFELRWQTTVATKAETKH